MDISHLNDEDTLNEPCPHGITGGKSITSSSFPHGTTYKCADCQDDISEDYHIRRSTASLKRKALISDFLGDETPSAHPINNKLRLLDESKQEKGGPLYHEDWPRGGSGRSDKYKDHGRGKGIKSLPLAEANKLIREFLSKKADEDGDIFGATHAVDDVAEKFGETSENAKRGLPSKALLHQALGAPVLQQPNQIMQFIDWLKNVAVKNNIVPNETVNPQEIQGMVTAAFQTTQDFNLVLKALKEFGYGPKDIIKVYNRR